MNINVLVGDVLDCAADALICPANPWLNLSGGVGGAILSLGIHSVQKELHEHLNLMGKPAIDPGTVVITKAGSLPFKNIIHAVAIDPFYDSSIELVRRAFSACLEAATTLSARSLSVPALATGYGRLTIEEFSIAVAPLIAVSQLNINLVQFVFRSDEHAEKFREIAFKQFLPNTGGV